MFANSQGKVRIIAVVKSVSVLYIYPVEMRFIN